MFVILLWAIFGLIVGLLSKVLHPGDDPIGCLPTIGIGIGGSFIGGCLNWALGLGDDPFQPSGFVMSIIGGIICCAAWRWYALKNSSTGPKSFLTGKKLK